MRRVQNEKRIVKLMIEIYCKKHHNGKCLCKDCEELLNYAHERAEKCPFGENKSFCQNCKVHCYNSKKRDNIRKVMKFSGPRIIVHHPIVALKYLISTIKERKNNR